MADVGFTTFHESPEFYVIDPGSEITFTVLASDPHHVPYFDMIPPLQDVPMFKRHVRLRFQSFWRHGDHRQCEFTVEGDDTAYWFKYSTFSDYIAHMKSIRVTGQPFTGPEAPVALKPV